MLFVAGALIVKDGNEGREVEQLEITIEQRTERIMRTLNAHIWESQGPGRYSHDGEGGGE